MSVLAALQSGVGLVTAFVPASLAPAFAARAPETMWVGWPETPEGGLAMEGMHLWRERAARASALLVGPGAIPGDCVPQGPGSSPDRLLRRLSST